MPILFVFKIPTMPTSACLNKDHSTMQKLIDAYKANPTLANAKRVFMHDHKHAFSCFMINADDQALLQQIIARYNSGV